MSILNKINKMYFVWGIVVFLIFVLLTIFGFMYKNKTSFYKSLEEKLVNAEKKYADAKFLYPQNGETVKITAKEMIEYGALDSLEYDGEICDGYATVQKKGTVFDFKGYVSCKNYKTKGYEN